MTESIICDMDTLINGKRAIVTAGLRGENQNRKNPSKGPFLMSRPQAFWRSSHHGVKNPRLDSKLKLRAQCSGQCLALKKACWLHLALQVSNGG